MTREKKIKVTREMREQAALICDVEASTPDLCGSSNETAQALGYSDAAAELAIAVAIPLYGICEGETVSEAYAEAAIRLCAGRCPRTLEIWEDS